MSDQVTKILEELRDGAPGAEQELFQLVYGELKRLAAAQLRGQPPGRTLQPTALVHEAYMRLVGGAPQWEGRAHFFGSAARAMRLVVVDYARRATAAKRGGGQRPITLHDNAGTAQQTADVVLAVHEALDRLADHDPLRARVVELRFFAGLEFAEVAAAVGVSARTAQRAWEQARTWLRAEIEK